MHDAHAALAIKYGADVKPGEGVTIGVFDSGSTPATGNSRAPASPRRSFRTSPTRCTRTSGRATTRTAPRSPASWPRSPTTPGSSASRGGPPSRCSPHRSATTSKKTRKSSTPSTGRRPIGTLSTMAWTSSTRATASSARSSRTTPRTGYGATKRSRAISGKVAQKGVADPAIFVWAAGNDHGDPCEDGDENCVPDAMSRTGYRFDATSPNLDGGGGRVAPGVAGPQRRRRGGGRGRQDRRLLQPLRGCRSVVHRGARHRPARRPVDSRVPPTTFGSENLEGTSFATPLVSGGLALIKHFFRGQLSNRELVTRLLVTAENDGIYASDRTDGTSSIYGQGLMDLGAAVSPVRGVRLTQSSPVDPGGHSVHGTRLGLGPAFGDGLSRSLAGGEIASFDSLGAPFWLPLETLVRPSYRPPSLPGRHPLAARDTGPSPADPRGDGATLGLHAFTARPAGGGPASANRRRRPGATCSTWRRTPPPSPSRRRTGSKRPSLPPRATSRGENRTSAPCLPGDRPAVPSACAPSGSGKPDRCLAPPRAAPSGVSRRTACTPGSRPPADSVGGVSSSTPRSAASGRTRRAGSSTACPG